MNATRYSRTRYAAIVGLSVAISAVLVVACAIGYLRYRFAQIPRARCGDCVAEAAGAPFTVMVVGSDSRARIPRAEAKSFCERRDCSDQSGPEHSDTLILVRVDPAKANASLLSIPRDLYVAIAGTTRRDRINAAFSISPNALVETIRQNLGVVVNHYVVVDFVGFRDIVRDIGGVDVFFPAPARDRESGLYIPRAGCVTLDPNNALGYVRSRHYEYLEAGRWHDDPYSDLSRIQRQQDFIRRVMRKALSVRNPLTIDRLITSGVRDVRMDDGLSEGDIVTLGRRLHSLSPATVQMLTLPTDDAVVDGADVLTLRRDAALTTVRRFLDPNAGPGPTPSVPLPNEIRVHVLNGTGVPGAATALATQLGAAGFEVAGTDDAASAPRPTSVLRYAPRERDKAKALQAALGGAPVTVEEDPTLEGADVTLVVGRSVPTVHPGATSPGRGPTTTVPGPVATPGGPRSTDTNAAQC